MEHRLIVVGCSWGGLRAVSSLLDALPSDLPAAILVGQHRGTADSQLVELLARHTTWEVRDAEDKDRIRPGRVYVAPANYHLLVERDGLMLSTDAPLRYSRPSIDILFETAADAYTKRVIAVVLTGANADGAEGVVTVVSRGGYVLVEDPATAERPEMPLAAIATGIAHEVLAIPEIASRIVSLCANVTPVSEA